MVNEFDISILSNYHGMVRYASKFAGWEGQDVIHDAWIYSVTTGQPVRQCKALVRKMATIYNINLAKKRQQAEKWLALLPGQYAEMPEYRTTKEMEEVIREYQAGLRKKNDKYQEKEKQRLLAGYQDLIKQGASMHARRDWYRQNFPDIHQVVARGNLRRWEQAAKKAENKQDGESK